MYPTQNPRLSAIALVKKLNHQARDFLNLFCFAGGHRLEGMSRQGDRLHA
jgi:hypothetical protein